MIVTIQIVLLVVQAVLCVTAAGLLMYAFNSLRKIDAQIIVDMHRLKS